MASSDHGISVSTGLLEFDEFCQLVKGMNPIVEESGSALSRAKALSAAATVLDNQVKISMHPFQMEKAGIIVQKLEAGGFGEADINLVCKALFGDQDEEDMRAAWSVFQKVGTLLST